MSTSVFSDFDELSSRIESALSLAGNNAPQLHKALDEVDDTQAEGMRFLIAYMPERDLKSLSADFLLSNVDYAYRAWQQSPWKERVPKEIFLNDVLPYASINERRDDWRKDFYTRFKPLVSKAKSPSEAAIILNQQIFKMLDVRFSRKRPKADQSPYETIKDKMASCTGLSILLIDACRAVGVPARFAGIASWPDESGNHSWVEIWDGKWHYTGAGEPVGDSLNKAWFTAKARTAQKHKRMNAIYAASFKHTDQKLPLVWKPDIDYVYALNVTDRYKNSSQNTQKDTNKLKGNFDIEASLHAVDQLKTYLQVPHSDRSALAKQVFADVPLTRSDAEKTSQLLWEDHVNYIRKSRADEMKARQLTIGKLAMPFYYSLTNNKPEDGRSLYISMHGGGGAPKRVNDSQWNNQKKLYNIPEGVYLAPRAPNDTWNMWHQDHIDKMFDRLIENLIVFEDVNPNRVYLLGYSAGGDGVYQLGPRMADRWAAASMMAGHPNNASPVNLYNTPFTIHVGANDGAYNRNKVAVQWGQKLDDLQKNDPDGYIHWTKIYQGRGHWIEKGAVDALPWMAQFTRIPLPKEIVWRQNRNKRFYWLATEKLSSEAVVRATLKSGQIDLKPGGVDKLIIRLNDQMLDLDENVVVKSNGKELFNGHIDRTIAVIAKTLEERGDPTSIFSGEISVSFEQEE